MNDRSLPDGKRQRPGTPLRLVALTVVLSAFAPLAVAQEADITGILTGNVRCSSASAKEDLGYNIKKLETTPEAIGAALNVVAADAARCAPLREAAAELAAGYVVQPVQTAEELAAASTRKVIEQTLAEADRNAASLRFEVGPPPRKMTAGRGPGPETGS